MPDLGTTVEYERQTLNSLKRLIDELKAYATTAQNTMTTDGAVTSATIVAEIQVGLGGFPAAEAKLAEACAVLNDAHTVV